MLIVSLLLLQANTSKKVSIGCTASRPLLCVLVAIATLVYFSVQNVISRLLVSDLFNATKTFEMLKFQITRKAENLNVNPLGFYFYSHSK